MIGIFKVFVKVFKAVVDFARKEFINTSVAVHHAK